MSYRKNASSNRDALFGDVEKPKKSSKAGAASSSSSRPMTSSDASRRPTSQTATASAAAAPTMPAAAVPSSRGYQGSTRAAGKTTTTAKKKTITMSADARAGKLAEAEDNRKKANAAMQKSFFNKPDPVAASTYFKRAADAYQQLGDVTNERLFRLESAKCNMSVGAWSSAAHDFGRTAELLLEEVEGMNDDDDIKQFRQNASLYHQQAGEAWLQMGEKAKAAGCQIQAALCLMAPDARHVPKDALTSLEAAIEAHVPDVFNPYARYRQTGRSAYVDPHGDETVETVSAATQELAREHMVTRAYAHEPLQKLTNELVTYGEYASALYCAGAASCILAQDGLSTLSLGRAFLVETVLTLALGDAVAAEQAFLQRHVQHTFYLTARECQLAEELFRAVKQRDADALEEARDPAGRNRAALSNLSAPVRELVTQLRVAGVARKKVPDTSNVPNDKLAPMSLGELAAMKTGYEEEVAQGEKLNTDSLAAELDGLDFDEGLDDDDSDNVGAGGGDYDDLDGLGDDNGDDDDDFDLR